MNSSLSLEEISWLAIDKRSYPGTTYEGFDPPYEAGRETIPFQNSEDEGMLDSVKGIIKI